MAQKIQTLFIDDIDGSDAEGTVRFALDGTEYEIDLNGKHAESLRNALAKYVEHARKAAGTTRRPAGRARGQASGVDTNEIRAWAKAQGIEVKDRGRVPAELVTRFKNRHIIQPPAAPQVPAPAPAAEFVPPEAPAAKLPQAADEPKPRTRRSRTKAAEPAAATA